ncbi:MAG: Ni/Fe hydrogenase [Aquificae bacterium]|nr:Ni/Fe hydrogenase [Aquificota bacterium]
MEVIWLHGLSCNGNTQSFLSMEGEEFELLLENFNFLYQPTLSSEEELESVLSGVLERGHIDLLILEGAIDEESEFKLLGESYFEIVRRLCSIAGYVIALGNCAAYGNIPALTKSSVKGLQYRFREKGGFLGGDFLSRKGYPVINLTGCPAHPRWLISTMYALKERRSLPLDEYGRPKELYAFLTHQGCTRNEYFEWKVEAEEFGRREGCLFYRLGCRGPMTHSSCNVILWHGESSKTRAGQPCFGCTEFDFPRENLFTTQLQMGIPRDLPEGVSKRGYIMISGVAKSFTPERLKKRLVYEDNEETPGKS